MDILFRPMRWVFLGVAFTIPAFAPQAESSSPEQQLSEQKVKERAEQRWRALIQGDVAKAYEFLSPAYRQAVPIEVYGARLGGAVQWNQALVDSINCNPESCSLKIAIDYKHRSTGQHVNRTFLDEKWIRVDDQWWYFPITQ